MGKYFVNSMIKRFSKEKKDLVCSNFTNFFRKEPERVDVFHSFVRPVINPKLSEFCKSLTGIEQETVDKAEVFQDVLIRFESWMKSHGLGKYDFYLVFYSIFKTKKATMYDNQLDFLMELHLQKHK